ncbi:unnamed protein product [Prorocentrum cordatum]|uniref:Probable acetate kinase n=1 Tax=Prorocentrum cordatum TaxID=2364126 RepID=A0ABN9WU73_9DINO|nr:unnamed protein product [Polarella glacialis]
MPAESFLYAVPKEWYEKYGVRRYGFHGTSYSYVLGRVASELQRPASSLNLIVCHIGSGASMVCIKGGKFMSLLPFLPPTVGFTPLDGLVMGTRSGDVDAGVFGHLTKAAGLSVGEVDSALNKKSGLYGLCGFSDMRAVQERADGGDADAALAERIFVERVRKYLGAYLVRLRNNVDAIVFTAGVGENSARFRALACEGLEEFGIKIAPGKNLAAKGVARIEDAFSRTKVMVVPTDEEGSIAIQAIDLVGVLPEPAQEVPAALPGRRRRPKHDLLVVGESSHSGWAHVPPPPPSWKGEGGGGRGGG